MSIGISFGRSGGSKDLMNELEASSRPSEALKSNISKVAVICEYCGLKRMSSSVIGGRRCVFGSTFAGLRRCTAISELCGPIRRGGTWTIKPATASNANHRECTYSDAATTARHTTVAVTRNRGPQASSPDQSHHFE